MAFKFKSAVTALVTSTVLTTTAMADEFKIDRLFVIGDSLSDGGAYSNTGRAATGATIQGLQGAGQPVDSQFLEAANNNIRYKFLDNAADGSSQVYAEVVAEGLGIDLQPNFINGLFVPDGMGGLVRQFPQDPVGGTNFAQGGSRVVLDVDDDDTTQVQKVDDDKDNSITSLDPLTVEATQIPSTVQIDRLLADTPSFNSNDLVIYWVGANDVSTNAESVAAAAEAAGLQAALAGGTQAEIQAAAGAAALTAQGEAGQAVALAATQAVGQVERLIEAGATNLVVVTVPDIGTSTPVGQESGPSGAALLSGLSNAYNSILVNGVAGRATVVDAGAVINEVVAEPVRYGFSDIDHLDLDNTACATASSLTCVRGATTRDGIVPIFADDRHPTALAHRALGEMALSALVAIGQAGVIPVATITGLRQQSLGLEQRLNLGAFFINDETGTRIRRPVGNVEVYGGVEAGFYESDQQQVVPGFDATTQVVKVAADVVVADNVMVGIGGSIDHGQIEYADGKGGFDSRLLVGGVFGVAQIIPGVYVNSFLGGGVIDVYDIDRSFTTSDLGGNVVSRNNYEADTDGTYFIARTNVGAVLPVGEGFFVNPSVGFAYERVDIDGYEESARGGAPSSLAARVGDLEYEGYRGTVALGGFYRPPSAPSWTFGLRGSWEHDFNDDEVKVPFAVGTSPTNVQIAPRPDDSYGLLSATVVKELSHSTSMNLQGSTNVGQDGVTGYTLGLVFKHSF